MPVNHIKIIVIYESKQKKRKSVLCWKKKDKEKETKK